LVSLARLNFTRFRRSLQHQPRYTLIDLKTHIEGHIMHANALLRQSASRLSHAWPCGPLQAHKAPTPEPNDDPLPGEHPVPQEEPVPSPKPESRRHEE
jgi:hypothetical protein